MFGSTFISTAAAFLLLAPAVLSAPVTTVTKLVDVNTYTTTVVSTFSDLHTKLTTVTTEIQGLDFEAVGVAGVVTKIQEATALCDTAYGVVAGLKLKAVIGAEVDVNAILSPVELAISEVLFVSEAAIAKVGVTVKTVPEELHVALVALGAKVNSLLVCVNTVVGGLLVLILGIVAKLTFAVGAVVDIIACLRISICFGFFGIAL